MFRYLLLGIAAIGLSGCMETSGPSFNGPSGTGQHRKMQPIVGRLPAKSIRPYHRRQTASLASSVAQLGGCALRSVNIWRLIVRSICYDA
jgi:hypothetical protein